MSAVTSLAGLGATRSTTIARATKASGAIVNVEPSDFLDLVRCQEAPLVIHAASALMGGTHRYLCSFKGFTFFTKVGKTLELPDGAVVVEAKKIWVPG